MDVVELGEYLQPLRKWWWMILLTTAVAGVSSYTFLQSQPPMYQSLTTIMIGAGLHDLNPNNNQLGLAEQLAQAYADIAERATVRQATMQALNLPSLPTYTVKTVENSPLIEITVTDQDAVIAQAVANELATQLILQSPAGQEEHERQQFLVEQLTKLEASITETEQEIALKQDELATMFSAREIANAQDLILALQNKLSSLRANYSSLLDNSQQSAVNRITVVEPAVAATRPIGQNLLRNLMMAIAIGFVLSSGGAYLLEYLDDSIQSGAIVRQQLGLPLLATIPLFEHQNKVVNLNTTSPALTEAYRGLRTNLLYNSLTHPTGVLLITGPAPHDGKSFTAANLAITLACAGKRVILIDSDLHQPKQHQLFHLSNTEGLSTALLDINVDLKAVLRTTAIPNLRVLTSGPLPHNPSELLGSERMRQLLSKLKDDADIVLLDTPPVNAVVDATVLATQVEGVLLVLRADRTSLAVTKRTLEMLSQVAAPMLGVVLNGVTHQQSLYTYIEYGYGIQLKEKKAARRARPFFAKGKDAALSSTEFFLKEEGKDLAKVNRHKTLD